MKSVGPYILAEGKEEDEVAVLLKKRKGDLIDHEGFKFLVTFEMPFAVGFSIYSGKKYKWQSGQDVRNQEVLLGTVQIQFGYSGRNYDIRDQIHPKNLAAKYHGKFGTTETNPRDTKLGGMTQVINLMKKRLKAFEKHYKEENARTG